MIEAETSRAARTLGIVGGIGPESTIAYYSQIVAAYRARKPGAGYPAVILNSIDLDRMVQWFTAHDLDHVTEYLLQALRQLAAAGADFGIIAANTPHLVFDDVQRRSPLPLISIVEAACDAAERMALTRVGLLGTRFTMQSAFYSEVFARRGIAVVAPDAADQEYIHAAYMNELIPGIFLPATRARLVAIIDRMKQATGIQGAILGGTELPLILTDAAVAGIPLLDTTRIHVEQAVARLLE